MRQTRFEPSRSRSRSSQAWRRSSASTASRAKPGSSCDMPATSSQTNPSNGGWIVLRRRGRPRTRCCRSSAATSAPAGSRRWCAAGSRRAASRAAASAARRAPAPGRCGAGRSRASTSPSRTAPGTCGRQGSGSGTRVLQGCGRRCGSARTRRARGRGAWVPSSTQGAPRLQSVAQMQVNRNDTVLSCAICERTLLLGEKVAGYLHAGGAMSVCELCVDEADQRGWRRAGAPTPPPSRAAVERGPGLLGRLLGRERDRGRRVVEVLPERAVAVEAPAAGDGETLTQEGAALFNESQYARTINGLAGASAPRRSRSCRSRARARRSWSRSPGTSPGTSTGSTPRRPRSTSRAAATTPSDLARAGRTGTPTWPRTAGSRSPEMSLTELAADLEALRADLAEELLAINRYEAQTYLPRRRGGPRRRRARPRREEAARGGAARPAAPARRQAAREARPLG